MLVEGIDVYLMLVKVFDTGRSMVTYFYVIGYGGPAVIVVLSVIIVEASGTHGYGTPDQWVIHNTQHMEEQIEKSKDYHSMKDYAPETLFDILQDRVKITLIFYCSE